MTPDKQKNYYQKHREAILQKEKENRPERRDYHVMLSKRAEKNQTRPGTATTGCLQIQRQTEQKG